MLEKTLRFLAVLSIGGLFAACNLSKSANPLSPAIAGPIEGVVIGEPALLEPAAGQEIDGAHEQPVRLVIQNATTSGVRPLSYRIQIATDEAFTQVVFSAAGVTPGEEGQTVVQLPDALPKDKTYFWRVRAEDGANTGAYSAPQRFVIFTPVEIGVAALRAPIKGETIAGRRPTFRIGRPPRSGPAGRIFYQLEVSTSQVFLSRLALYQLAEQGAETVFDAPLSLDYAQTVYWRVRAFDSGSSGVRGPWSPASSFRTPAAPPPPEPTPSPDPSPSPGAACGPPYPGTPLGIVQCQRSHYGHMSTSELVSFLRGVAHDLNAAGIGGGPYGLLRKDGGHSCNGYSCDIICAGQGGSQRQYDVLSDAEGAQIPVWEGPLSPFVARTCEF